MTVDEIRDRYTRRRQVSFPNTFLQDCEALDLSPLTIKVFQELKYMEDDKGVIDLPPATHLALMMDVSRQGVHKSYTELKNAGLLHPAHRLTFPRER